MFNSIGNYNFDEEITAPGTTTRNITFDGKLVSNQFTIEDGVPNQVSEGNFIHENSFAFGSQTRTIDEIVRLRNSPFNKP
jgi:hypothetical protein